MIDEQGEVLTPKIGTWVDAPDGELYDFVQCDHWNASAHDKMEIVEVWVYDRLEFMGYIIKPVEKPAGMYMHEFLRLYNHQNWNERARGVNQLPVILYKER